MNRLWRIVETLSYPARLLFPPKCVSCGQRSSDGHTGPVCADCVASVRRLPRNVCATCGGPLEFDYEIDSGETYSCGECIQHPPPFEKARFGLVYGGPAREILHAFKFKGRMALAGPLTGLAEERLTGFFEESKGYVVIPVPLSPWRLFTRGYNQSYLLARHFAEKAGLEIADGALVRVKHTQPQFGLGRKERGENVKGAFAVSERGSIKGRNVLLFDDIFTTGATARECARTLRKSGAKSVRVAALFWAGSGE